MSLVILSSLAAYAVGANELVEYTYSNQDCTAGQVVTQRWNVSKCVGIGNQPPYQASEEVTIFNSTVSFKKFIGGECGGNPYQVSHQTLNTCNDLLASKYTKFELVSL